MKRIVVMPDGNWLSHTSRAFEVARALRRLGHDVVYAGDGRYMKIPRQDGFEVLPIKTIDPDRALACSRRGRADWYDYDLIKECVREELRLFDEITPDLVLTDFRLTLSTSCELADIPLAALLNASWTNYYTVKTKAPEHLAVTRVFGKRLTNMFIPLVKGFIVTIDNRPFNKFRREQGLPARRNIWATWQGDLNLIVDIPEYGPTQNLPPNFHYIGPIMWEPEIEAPDWLEDLDPNRRTIYFSMGSTGYARFFEQAIEIYGGTEFQCIMTTAGMVDLPDVPENFYVVDYAPGSLLMEKSDVVVCHGGNGTIYQAMSRGVPIIGIPTMHDQEFNLDRVEELGIGIHLSEISFTPAHLTDAVDRILSDDTFRSNARRFEQILLRYDGPTRGAEIIDAFLMQQPLRPHGAEPMERDAERR
jgi:MGT family glycosyltransferase